MTFMQVAGSAPADDDEFAAIEAEIDAELAHYDDMAAALAAQSAKIQDLRSDLAAVAQRAIAKIDAKFPAPAPAAPPAPPAAPAPAAAEPDTSGAA